MENPASQSIEQNARGEEWFLSQLELSPVPANEIIPFLVSVREEGKSDQADQWAELLCDTLIERKDVHALLAALKVRVTWHPATSVMCAKWKSIAQRALESDAERKSFVDHVGFGQLAPVECVRRLELLMALKPGTLCLDKTWGFGVVKKADGFYGRVQIDFEKKPGHALSLAYAAEVLQLVTEDHILARLHREPEKMRELANSNPADVVRTCLRSYGPLTVAQLQSTLSPRLVAEAGWKDFWDGARRGLKKDPLVHIPTRRTEPIRLLQKEKSYDQEWFDALAKQRDMDTVLTLLDELVRDGTLLQADSQRRIAGDRLAFVIKGAGLANPEMVARSVMLARSLGVAADQVDAAKFAEQFLRADLFIRTIRALPARCVEPFLQFLLGHDKDRTVEFLFSVLKKVDLVALNEAMTLLLALGFESRVADLVRESISSQKAEVELLYWITRNMDKYEVWVPGTLPVLGFLVLSELEQDYSGLRLKAQNLLRGRFEQSEWLKPVLDAMRDAQRREFVLKLKDSPGWEMVDRRSVLATVVKLRSELQDVLAGGGASTAAPAPRVMYTSNRSYIERQQQLEKLIKVDIPQNSKEIAVARSYGDLSENHEFKAAKEMQGILLRRRGELEDMLRQVKPTDFQGFPQDGAGIATGVKLRYEDGREESYFILGEWDKDEAHGIISCETRMAKALDGHKAGDTVVVPTESGDVTCTIVEVRGLSDEVRSWIDGK